MKRIFLPLVVLDGDTPEQIVQDFDTLKLADVYAVIACYHDQAMIPVKCLSFGEAVNVTLGLPFIRTSVDHGTAFDIAGKGLAEHSSMVAAIELAAQLSTQAGESGRAVEV